MAEHTYGDFTVEIFEASRDQWLARVRRSDRGSFVIDGVILPDLDVRFSWRTSDSALQDACRFIDRMIGAGT